MNVDQVLARITIIRIVVISGIVIGISTLVSGIDAFNPRSESYIYVHSSITISIAYASFRVRKYKTGLVVLSLWLAICAIVLDKPYHTWNYIRGGAYIYGLSGVLFYYLKAMSDTLSNSRLKRIITVTTLIGVAEALIVIFLQAIVLNLFTDPIESFKWAYKNLKDGLIIGFLSVVAMEITEYYFGFSGGSTSLNQFIDKNRN